MGDNYQYQKCAIYILIFGGLHSKITLLTFYLADLALYLLRSSLKWYALNMKYAPNSQLLKSSISL